MYNLNIVKHYEVNEMFFEVLKALWLMCGIIAAVNALCGIATKRTDAYMGICFAVIGLFFGPITLGLILSSVLEKLNQIK